MTFSNVVAGTGTGIVTLAGLGTVWFTKTNTFTNPVTVNMANAAFLGVGGVFGSVVLGSNNALGAGTNTLTLTSGAPQSGMVGGVTLSNPITFSNSTVAFTGNDPLTFTGNASLSSTSGNTNTIEVQNALQRTVFGGVVSGTGTLTLVGRGTLVLQAANTNSGAVTISGGTLQLSGAGALTGLTASSTLTVYTGGILALDNSGAAANNQTNRIADAAPIALAGGMIQLFGNATAATSETLGNVVLSSGQASIALTPGGSTTKLTLNNLTVHQCSGGTILFTGLSLGGSTNQVIVESFNTTSPLVNGVIPYATVSTPNGLELASYVVNSGGYNGIINYSSNPAVATPKYSTSVATLKGDGSDNLNLSTDDRSRLGQHQDQLADADRRGDALDRGGFDVDRRQRCRAVHRLERGDPRITGGGALILGSTATPDGVVFVAPASTARSMSPRSRVNLSIAGGGTLTLPNANPSVTGTFTLAGGTTLAIGSPLSLGTSTLHLISGSFQTSIGASASLPGGLVLNNTLGFLNSDVTLGGNGNPITFTGAIGIFAGSNNIITIDGSNSITLGGAITGTAALIKQGTGTACAFRHQHHELQWIDERHFGNAHNGEQQRPGDCIERHRRLPAARHCRCREACRAPSRSPSWVPARLG